MNISYLITNLDAGNVEVCGDARGDPAERIGEDEPLNFTSHSARSFTPRGGQLL